MASLMMKSCYRESAGETPIPLVDLGYWSEETAKRYDALREFGIARRRFSREGHDRLLMEVPPTKLQAVLGAFPIVEGATYWRCTHHWEEKPSGAVMDS